MPTGLHLWSKTAASNASADSSINWAEGQSPASVNDSARAMMARVSEWRDDLGGITTGGSSTAYTITTNRVFASAAVMDTAIICIKPHTDSGASPTLAVDGLTARAINYSTGVAVATGALKSGTPYFVIYVHASTEFILLGALAVNSASVALAAVDIVGGTALTAPAVDDSLPIYDLSATANRKIALSDFFKVLTLLTAETSPAIDDELALYDLSATTTDKITLANLLKVVNGLTEDSSPDGANDFLLSYDASAGAAKKVKPSSLGSSQAVMESASSTASFVTPAVQHQHPSHLKASINLSQLASQTNLRSYGVSSIADGGVGTTSINFSTAFADTTYGWIGSARDNDSGGDGLLSAAAASAKTTSGIAVLSTAASSSAQQDSADVSVGFFGDFL